jgi:arsenate reductase (thioredoxin)
LVTVLARKGDTTKSLLFVCIENSSRSQMAEGFARELGLHAVSAGTVPSTHVNPLVIDAMREVGVDISGNKPRKLMGEMIDEADLVVLTDAPLEGSLPGNLRRKMRKKVVVWSVPDPQGKTIEEIRFIRDGIKTRVESLAKDPSLAGR